MRYGIFSDVHSNYEALKVVLEYLIKERADYYICLGDLVGYAAKPNECIEEIRKLSNIKIILGNHDAAVIGIEDLSEFNPIAKEAVLWTRKVLKKENMDFLLSLEPYGEEDGFFFVHGSPKNPLNEYLDELSKFKENIPYMKKNLYFIGHTHVPFCFYLQKEELKYRLFSEERFLKLDLNKNKYIINCGSVGQPRDSNPRACCGIYDSIEKEFKIKRLSYNIKKVQEEIVKVKLPFFLAYRLDLGV